MCLLLSICCLLQYVTARWATSFCPKFAARQFVPWVCFIFNICTVNADCATSAHSQLQSMLATCSLIPVRCELSSTSLDRICCGQCCYSSSSWLVSSALIVMKSLPRDIPCRGENTFHDITISEVLEVWHYLRPQLLPPSDYT